jgi:hypothetical protein
MLKFGTTLNEEGTYVIKDSKGKIIMRFRCKQVARDFRNKLNRESFGEEFSVERVK